MTPKFLREIGHLFTVEARSQRPGAERECLRGQAADMQCQADALEAMQSSAGDDGWSALQSPWGQAVCS